MAKTTTTFVCQECGANFTKWSGKCFDCGAWNSISEFKVAKPTKGDRSAKGLGAGELNAGDLAAKSLSEFDENGVGKGTRYSSGFSEADRVLGSGFLPGSLLLVGGEPGIGKSTLLLQFLGALSAAGEDCLYISGEESGAQVSARARRLGITALDKLKFLSTASLETALAAVDTTAAKIVVVDSVQTLYSDAIESAAGTVSQVREITQNFLRAAKTKNIIAILVGHVTKEGTVAGPRLLEHMVDGVFYFEMAPSGGFRLLRGQKNRFGPTHEVAVFEMGSHGLRQVDNPSARFLEERAKDTAGSSVVAHLEGSRPFLTEFQSLTQKCHSGFPRRTVQGVDQNRVSVLLAVIERSLRYSFSDVDVYCKVASGARLEEPAADLPVLTSLLSAALDKPIPSNLIVMGEVGLGGEVRGVPGVGARLMEARSVGIDRAIVPASNLKEAKEVAGIRLESISNIR